jgi:hypothetical protein
MRAAFRQEYRNIPLPLRAQKSSWLVGNAEDGQVFASVSDASRPRQEFGQTVPSGSAAIEQASDESLTSSRENSVRY